MSETAFDYVIVGAGSAGCVLANRLSADPATSVLLIEAGGSDRRLFSRMPAAFSLPMGRPSFDWCFRAEPASRLAGRSLDCPRGRLLGGSSSINGMVWVRGNAADFDRWQTLGAADWDFAHCLPYFKRAERVSADGTSDDFRGRDGPIVVSRGTMDNPLFAAFLDAAGEAGHARSDDLNGQVQKGFGALEMSVDAGVRCSTARAYLEPVRHRPNLSVLTGATVCGIDIAGDRALGVHYRQRAGVVHVGASREVILSAGAIGSPHLLLLSGVGPEDELREHGIAPNLVLPSVGANLMDHLEVYVQQSCVEPVSLNRQLGLMGKAAIGLRWLATRTGAGATNHFEAGGFVRSHPGLASPDIQFHFLPAAVSYDGSRAAASDGFQVHVGPMLSPTRGRLSLRNTDPLAAPRLDFNYMADTRDWEVFRTAIRKAREIFAQPSLARFSGPEIAPGPDADSDAALDSFIARNAESAYHPCGTCRMGEDADAVVDSECRVRGIDGLRVVDSSIFPHITNGNLNAPTIMVAERAADLILGNAPLAPESPTPR